MCDTRAHLARLVAVLSWQLFTPSTPHHAQPRPSVVSVLRHVVHDRAARHRSVSLGMYGGQSAAAPIQSPQYPANGPVELAPGSLLLPHRTSAGHQPQLPPFAAAKQLWHVLSALQCTVQSGAEYRQLPARQDRGECGPKESPAKHDGGDVAQKPHPGSSTQEPQVEALARHRCDGHWLLLVIQPMPATSGQLPLRSAGMRGAQVPELSQKVQSERSMHASHPDSVLQCGRHVLLADSGSAWNQWPSQVSWPKPGPRRVPSSHSPRSEQKPHPRRVRQDSQSPGAPQLGADTGTDELATTTDTTPRAATFGSLALASLWNADISVAEGVAPGDASLRITKCTRMNWFDTTLARRRRGTDRGTPTKARDGGELATRACGMLPSGGSDSTTARDPSVPVRTEGRRR